MATGYSLEATGVLDGTVLPASKFDGRVVGARLRRRRATLDLSKCAINSGDTNILLRIPAGEAFVAGVLTSSVDLGAAATIAIGKAGTPGKYFAAALFRTPNVPLLFGLAAAIAAAPLAAYEDVIVTIAVAALPNAGTVVIDFFTSGR